MTQNISDLFHIFEKVLKDINLDDSQDILHNALKSNLSSMKSSVASRGHSYVDRRIRGRYSARNFIDEKMNGISHLADIATLLNNVEADWSKFVPRLKSIRQVKSPIHFFFSSDCFLFDADFFYCLFPKNIHHSCVALCHNSTNNRLS